MRNRRRSLFAAAALLTTLAAGCGSDAEEPEPAPSPTGDASPGPTTPPAPPEAAYDVCRLIDEELLASVTPEGDEPRTVLGYGTEYMANCSIDGRTRFEFGVQVVPGFGEMPPETESTTIVPDLGDVSVLDENPPGLSATLWTQRGDRLFQVRNESLSDPDGVNDTDTMIELMRVLLDVDEARLAEIATIELGPRCPAADAPEVVAVAGTVLSARGGHTYDNGVDECQYFGEGGTRVVLDHTAQEGAADDFVTADTSLGDEDFSMEGADRAVLSPEEISLSWATGPDLAWMVGATALVGTPDYEAERTAEPEALVALGQLYASLNPDAGD